MGIISVTIGLSHSFLSEVFTRIELQVGDWTYVKILRNDKICPINVSTLLNKPP